MTTASVPSPLSVICPACNAQAGSPCTQPTDRSRNPVKFFHYPRVELALEPPSADPVEEILTETRLQFPEVAAVNELQRPEKIPTYSTEYEAQVEAEVLRHPAELEHEAEWQSVTTGSVTFDTHRLCGTVLVPGHRAMHEVSCPAATKGMTQEQRAEAQRTSYPTSRAENEERQIAWALSRHRKNAGRQRSPFALAEADRAADLLRLLGLQPFTVYSEGYAATGESGGAMSHGVHWGRDFNDAIRRWKDEGGDDARYLSEHKGSWTYWGCKLFDNLADAQRSFG